MASARDRITRPGLATGALAGLIGGLAVAVRDVLVPLGWSDLREPARVLRESGMYFGAAALVGIVLGLAAVLVLPLLLRVSMRALRAEGSAVGGIAAFLGLVALLAIVARSLVASPVAQSWLEISVVTVAMLALSQATGRSAPATVAWMAAVGGGVLATEVAFFSGQGLVNDLSPALLRGLGYAAISVVALMLGVGAWRLLWCRLVRAAQWLGAVGGAIAAAALVLLPAGALTAWELSLEGGQLSRQTAALGEHDGNPGAPNIILISIDTLRADAPGFMGGEARTPTLDALAAQSTVFERAYSVAPWTRPSFAAFFSSLYPSEMGVARLRTAGETPVQWQQAPTLLAEALQAAGYTTAGIVTNAHLRAEANANQGFEVYHFTGSERPAPLPAAARALVLMPPEMNIDEYERADVVQRNAARVLPQLKGRPLLLWLHYLDPHHAYDSPDAPPESRVNTPIEDLVMSFVMNSAPEIQTIRAAYTAEIEYCDRWLGQTVRTLQDAGLWQDAIVVLWSDHGEEFWEHGGFEHGHSLYDEQLHVPFAIRVPGQTAGQVVRAPVSLLDAMPTILDLTQVRGPEGMRGRSLRPVLEDPGARLPELRVFAEACHRGPEQKALLTERYKLIYNVYLDRFELYDLQADPGELHDLYGRPGAPDTTAMEAELREFSDRSLAAMDATRDQAREDVPEEMREQLRDMGYVN